MPKRCRDGTAWPATRMLALWWPRLISHVAHAGRASKTLWKPQSKRQAHMHEIRFANESDRAALTQFIDEQWKKNHIFVQCRPLLDWQHFDRERERYNFIIGIEKQTRAVHGVLGFIPLSQFDPEIELGRLCWMALWKTHEEARGHKLGRRLMSFLEDTINPEILSTVAASVMTLQMYQAKGYQVGKLSQYFIINPVKKSFHLVSVPGVSVAGGLDGAAALEPVSEHEIAYGTNDCFLAQTEIPRKSPAYLINRYLRHPFYRYQSYKIRDGGKTTGLVVTRTCGHDGARAIRIVDFVGPSRSLRGLRPCWLQLLRDVDAEYLDFYCAGIDDGDLVASGFSRRNENDGVVIPNYFEPFAKSNVEIDYMISTAAGRPFRIVKGDSDQDRPNIVPVVTS
jgi:hypothetical protein